MENKEIASVFKLVGQLMDLHGENKFKVRSYSNAAFQLGKLPKPLQSLTSEELECIPGIGKNLLPKLKELISTGELGYLNAWLDKTPEGVVEMLRVKGLGPGKVRTIWQDFGAESIGELLYACNENRLIDLKGFGEKTQLQVQESIEFMMEHKNKFLYATIEPLINDIKQWVKNHFPFAKISETGAALRRDLVLEQLEMVFTEDVEELPDTTENRIEVVFHKVSHDLFDDEVDRLSLSKELTERLQVKEKDVLPDVVRRIVPEMRNVPWALKWSEDHNSEELITNNDLRGCLHNHSTFSDGIHLLEDMALYLKGLGFQYFGISDHSKTAVYAGGLTEQEIITQHEEINDLNKRLKPFKVLKGIESDILSDGSLDYSNDVLSSFDFVVASIHSSMKMNEEIATKRLIKAIENPYTSILGHPTGRLLLARPGYPINHRKIIDACSANHVAIELNANPMRLDIDYTWIPYCMEKDVFVSINPDAHRIEGFNDMRFGVMAARKGGLMKENTLNALSLEGLEHYFRSKSK
ncbi:MAG: PHP domain-containing protein [Salibacteraceae bacterium]